MPTTISEGGWYARRVSYLATASRRARSKRPGATAVSRLRDLGVTADIALAALLAAGFAVVVFVASGGTDLAPNTWVEIGLLAVAAVSVVAIALRPSRPASRPVIATL